MKKKALAAVLLISLFSLTVSGCGGSEEEEEGTEANEEYIAVYEEITMTESPPPPEEAAPLPAAYSYSYLDHILILGDEVCGGLISHGLMEEDSVISVAGVQTESLMRTLTERDVTAAKAVTQADKPYIYLWTGVHDIFSGLTAEEYGETVVEAAEELREQNPESMVIILSMTPAAETKGAGDTIAEFNSALHSAVKGCPDRYMIYMDIFSGLADENGFLKDIYDMGDGVNLSRAGCRRVISMIEEERFYNDLCGDGKYRYIYKDIYSERGDFEITEGKIAYLTFDDGPSKHTPEILDILAANDIKATFFITGWCIEGKEDTLKRVAAEGHTVALHSWSHDYELIYESTEAFLDDFARVYNRVYDVTGKKPWAFRFPGGSYNNFNRDTADEIIAEMQRRGFAYYDWNAATSDATTAATYDSCIEYLTDSLIYDHAVVLMHDSLELTPQYLQEV
ncbi:MAG: polysaccharide deacetylase family protein, partial [Ruminococcus sp.]|nr:polysaccharide deacetylase family protein [Ruminococcus sp.]